MFIFKKKKFFFAENPKISLGREKKENVLGWRSAFPRAKLFFLIIFQMIYKRRKSDPGGLYMIGLVKILSKVKRIRERGFVCNLIT